MNIGIYEQIINKLFEEKIASIDQAHFFIGERSINKNEVVKLLSLYLTSIFEQVLSSVVEPSEDYEIEDETDNLEEALRERHVHRVESGVCSFINTEHYVEILSNLERMGDHLKNVLDSIVTVEYCKNDEFHH